MSGIVSNSSKKRLSATLPISVLLAGIFLSSLMSPNVFSVQPPVVQNQYFISTIGQPRRVDPARAYDTESGELIQNVYETMIRFSSKPVAPDADTDFAAHPELVADLSQFEPLLVTEVPTVLNGRITNDGKDWNFTINEPATFHPWFAANGTLIPATPLTAADVEYTFKRMLVQDMLGAPSWMIALPGTGYMYYDDFDTNPATNTIEPPANEANLGNLIDNFITVSGSDVTFHFATAWSEIIMKQIFAHTCSSIVSKAFCIEHGCWNGSFAPGWSQYRRYASSLYSPLDKWVPTSRYTNDAAGNKNGWGNGDVPAMIGTGPYNFTSWDKANKAWRIDWYSAYWKGWADAGNKGGVPGVSYFQSVIWRAIDQWKTREMLFLSGEYDRIEVPRAHMYDLLVSQYVPIGGVRLYYNMPALKNEAMAFCFNVDPTSLYQSKVGTGGSATVRTDFFSNIHVRKAFVHALNFTAYLETAWFNEAIQPASWWVEGLQPDYKNKELVPYALDTAKIEAELMAAEFPGVSGNVWTRGFETYLVFDFGKDQRRIAAQMIQQTFASLGARFRVNVVDATRDAPIQPPQYRDYWEQRMLPVFFVGKSADFADADSFARPYMHSYGEFAYFQGYNNTEADYLIDLGITQPDVLQRNATYQELQQVYWNDIPSLPLAQPVERRWTRDWVKGWYYNQLLPGDYCYDLYKSAAAMWLVDLDVTHTITPVQDANRTTLIFHGQMRIGNTGGLGQPASGNANPQIQYWNISVLYKAGGAVPVLYASLGLKRNSTLETQYPNGTIVVLSPGQTKWTIFQWYEDGVEQFVLADYAQDGTSRSGTPYTIAAVSYPVTGTESNPADNLVIMTPNTYWNASRLNGDVNGNGVVDIYDAILLSNSFGSSQGSARYNVDADFKPDGTIDIYDAILLSTNFGKHVP